MLNRMTETGNGRHKMQWDRMLGTLLIAVHIFAVLTASPSVDVSQWTKSYKLYAMMPVKLTQKKRNETKLEYSQRSGANVREEEKASIVEQIKCSRRLNEVLGN
ncbi:CLUMA_CG019840, isoform A [Clunio marinus]|uniref:CLUMA_CG019840, isoform A n=1 Tax=Clunio marinus TaxID=568069 RepID=A0A1J1J7B3_9DIPT|nr:CLUMA_CG019840, isoform A [Clunio marinus]